MPSYVFDGAQTAQPDQCNLRINEITTQRNLFSFQETHTFTPSLVNSARFGVNRVVAEIGLTPTALQPIAADTSYGFLPGKTGGNLNISGLTNFTGGLGAASPYHFHWTSLQGYDDVKYAVGRNSLRFGIGVERMRDNMISTADPNGIFTFNSLSDYLTNRPFSLTIAIPGTTSPRDLRQTLFAAYFQYGVRLRSNLTANLSLRYETTTVPTETAGRPCPRYKTSLTRLRTWAIPTSLTQPRPILRLDSVWHGTPSATVVSWCGPGSASSMFSPSVSVRTPLDGCRTFL